MVALLSIWQQWRETRWWGSWSNSEHSEGNLKSRLRGRRASIDSVQAARLEGPIFPSKPREFAFNSMRYCTAGPGDTHLRSRALVFLFTWTAQWSAIPNK